MTVTSVAEAKAMDRAALIAAWDRFFNTPVPKNLSQPFLRRFIAFEQQAQTYGGLPKGFARALNTAANEGVDAGNPALEPGSRLIREWNGVTHMVDVTDEGFIWKNQRYRSLSSVARAITGARWSGPRFFGVNGKGLK